MIKLYDQIIDMRRYLKDNSDITPLYYRLREQAQKEHPVIMLSSNLDFKTKFYRGLTLDLLFEHYSNKILEELKA
jgi:hypothetical protein